MFSSLTLCKQLLKHQPVWDQIVESTTRHIHRRPGLHKLSFWRKKENNFCIDALNSRNKMGGGVEEFKTLAKAVELDTEWFKSVTVQLPHYVKQSPNGSIIPFSTLYTNGHTPGVQQGGGLISDSTYPCPLCGMVTPSRSRHILNHCERLNEKYRWRKENIIHYVDSLLDHNSFKVFCNIQDRR